MSHYILIFCIKYQHLESYFTLLKKESHLNKEIEFSLNSEPKFFIQKALLHTNTIFGIISVHWHQNHKKIKI